MITFKGMDCYTFINQALEQIIPQICLSWLIDIILNGAEKGKHNGMILINLQKAFDTLDHTILLDKMKGISFSKKKKKK